MRTEIRTETADCTAGQRSKSLHGLILVPELLRLHDSGELSGRQGSARHEELTQEHAENDALRRLKDVALTFGAFIFACVHTFIV